MLQTRCLKPIARAFETEIVLKSDPDFVNETERGTEYNGPTFVLAAKPVIESDVERLVHRLTEVLRKITR